MELPSIESIFPLESGYQDLATLVNIWLGEFSQAGNEESDFDKVTKGSYEFDDETLRMFNVMFAHRFKNLKALEKTWIGTLNKEGSNPINGLLSSTSWPKPPRSCITSANNAVLTESVRTRI